MIIAVASGKGGTGKTTVATSLVLSLAAELNPPSLFLDCDVEAPNAHLFLKPVFKQRREVGILIPQVDEERCTHCGRCAEVCQYHAIAVLGEKTLVFPQLCHGCGSCTALCLEKAITELSNVMGVLERGQTPHGIPFARGVLNVGEPMAVPVIRQLKSWAALLWGQHVIMDCPPGTSCPVVASFQGSDFLLLVTEPTPFGLHDLRLAVQVARELGVPAGVVVNRDGSGNAGVDEFCSAEGRPPGHRGAQHRAMAGEASCAGGAAGIDAQPFLPSRCHTSHVGDARRAGDGAYRRCDQCVGGGGEAWLTANKQMLFLRGSGLALGFVQKGPIYEEALKHPEIEVFKL